MKKTLLAMLMALSMSAYAGPFVKGADIGWLAQMEATGYKFYNKDGKQEDGLSILKSYGINTVRLRVWVNPSQDRASGHNSKDDVVAMALRAQQQGMRVMINFHYSDSWADPQQQRKPVAWIKYSFPQLLDAVYQHTHEVMTALKKAGVQPEWVQVGNEIRTGMMYPEGHTLNWPLLAQLLNKGYNAVKAVTPDAKVVLHVDRGNEKQWFRTWFDNAVANGAKFDVIGMSYYPYWLDGNPDYTESIDDLTENMNDVAARYGKEVMIVEIGGEDSKPQNTYDMLVAVQRKVKAIPGNKGLGVIYWEPQGSRSWSKYELSAWGEDGRPTKAMEAFLAE